MLKQHCTRTLEQFLANKTPLVRHNHNIHGCSFVNVQASPCSFVNVAAVTKPPIPIEKERKGQQPLTRQTEQLFTVCPVTAACTAPLPHPGQHLSQHSGLSQQSHGLQQACESPLFAPNTLSTPTAPNPTPSCPALARQTDVVLRE